MESRDLIEQIVEASVTSKMNKINKWVIGMFVSTLGVLAVFLLGNSYWMGKMDARSENQDKMITQFIVEQREFNKEFRQMNSDIVEKASQNDKTINTTLDAISQNQLIVISNMKRLDPTFEIPIVIRGSSINQNNNRKTR